MTPDRPSQTAMATAFMRALHLIADDAPAVFEDDVASQLLPIYQRRFLARLGALPKPWLRTFRQRRYGLTPMRAQIVVRARYAEDALLAARSAGAERYLILAAGLDTFAQRQAGSDAPIAVIEVDHPATQAWKRDWLETHGMTARGVEYRAVDFERETLRDVLDTNDRPQFVSWLGTTYYLSREAIAATLAALADLSPRGSRLVLDYWRQPPVFDPSSALLWGTRLATALQQEPMRCFLEPAELEAMAREAGWRVRENCAPEIQNQRYLHQRKDGLAVPAFAYLAQLER
ncbi:MAG: class I SAM-dependent methyltransferase [Pseudomonadales bacterium]